MIALTTPTGTIGSKVLRRLLETTDEPVRVLARDPARLRNGDQKRVHAVTGSMQDPVALGNLLEDADVLFWCQPDAGAVGDYYAAYDALAEEGRAAIAKAGVPRVVAISAAGETPSAPAGPITALHRMEETLAESGASLRFLRCGSFMENLLWQWESLIERGVFVYSMDGTIRTPQICAADIARFAAEWLVRRDWTGREAIHVIGPDDLSYSEMAEILSRELARPVAYERMEPEAYRGVLVSLGSSPAAAAALTDMFAYLENEYHIAPGACRHIGQTSLSSWLSREG